uniref:Neural cell expressed, developmentally down-regulated 9 n=1 Tax=Laticauda laticaudata TaxID=8630 RepID=A0A8C5S7P5_LATLA
MFVGLFYLSLTDCSSKSHLFSHSYFIMVRLTVLEENHLNNCFLNLSLPVTFQICTNPSSSFRDNMDAREGMPDLAVGVKHEVSSEGVYDVPPPIAKAAASSELTPLQQGLYDVPADIYDTPRGIAFPGQHPAFGESLNPDGKEGIYDVPPQVTQDIKRLQDATDGINRLSFSSTGSTRSNMSTSSTTSKESSFSASPSHDRRITLDPDSAIERLYWNQNTVENTVASLMAFVHPDWRSYENMEKHINKIHTAVDKVEQSLVDYLHFAKGVTANASYLSELSLYNKMRRELQRLEDSYQILTQTSHDLSNCSWSLNVLAVNKPQNKCDDLDRFVMVARTIPDDTKQLTTSISVNAEVLFKQGPCSSYIKNASEGVNPTDHCTSLSPLLSKNQPYQCNSNNSLEKSWMDDYDYVHLQGKEEFERQQKELLEKENIVKQNKMQLEHHQLNQFQRLEQEITKPVENDMSKWKSPQSLHPTKNLLATQERQLLLFYSEQCETHFNSLLNAIDAFFSCISAAQPPRIFVAHSKFVILSAHKLVFIGDTLTRQLTTQEMRNSIMNSSNQLCDLLKTIVMSTKVAALNYPSTSTLQDMVDRVTDLSHYAQLFKCSLIHMASY